MARVRNFLLLVACQCAPLAAQDTIFWNSDPGAANLTSTGQAMDGKFRFELGVFAGSFVPTPANRSEWAASWQAARRTNYRADTSRFVDSFLASQNTAPFSAGKAVYVWGFRGDALAGEWILFRAPSWTWPAASFPPTFHEWFAKQATATLGTLHASGSPFLMQSAAVTHAAPPATSWSQWQAENLAGVADNGPAGDPDNDGVCNLLEYVFGSSPTVAGPPPSTPVAVVDDVGGKFQQITILRRIDHPAVLTVEVSGDLIEWHSGAGHTAVVENSLGALVVRDLTPVGSSSRRFMRVSAALP